jgi:formiminotetrahydrofolate cyclodeaminase
MYADLTIKEFLNETASSKAVPGGGSVAALGAALAAGLVEMVAGLTIGRKGFEAVDDQMREVAASVSVLKDQCNLSIDKDTGAYSRVIDAYRMPKSSGKEINDRTLAIQGAMKDAALVPMETAKQAYQIMEFAGFVVKHGNPNAVSDGLVAAMLARTAVLAGLYNVKINLASILDTNFVDDLTKQAKNLEDRVVRKEIEIVSSVDL